MRKQSNLTCTVTDLKHRKVRVTAAAMNIPMTVFVERAIDAYLQDNKMIVSEFLKSVAAQG